MDDRFQPQRNLNIVLQNFGNKYSEVPDIITSEEDSLKYRLAFSEARDKINKIINQEWVELIDTFISNAKESMKNAPKSEYWQGYKNGVIGYLDSLKRGIKTKAEGK